MLVMFCVSVEVWFLTHVIWDVISTKIKLLFELRYEFLNDLKPRILGLRLMILENYEMIG